MTDTAKNGAAKRQKYWGAARGNENAYRHGLKAGKLPRDAKYIEIRMNIVRRELEAAVVAAKGGVSITDAAYIQTAMRWERHAALAQRWLTKQYDELKPEQRLAFSEAIAKASTNRDKAVAALGLDRDTKHQLYEELYKLPAPKPGEEPQ
jgi:hypothetical protein